MQEIVFNHKPVLFEETIESLGIRPDGTYIDGTAGGGGPSGAPCCGSPAGCEWEPGCASVPGADDAS